jgi:hypothetical protein
MNTSFHFTLTQEITTVILDIIKRAYQKKTVSIYIREDEPFVPEWQIQEVRRDTIIENNPDYLLDCNMVISEIDN